MTAIFLMLNLIAQDDFSMKRFSSTGNPSNVVVEDFLAEKDEPLGSIVASYKDAKYLSNADTIYLKMKNPSISVGDRFSLYVNKGGVGAIDNAFKKVGNQIHVKGAAIVTQVTSSTIVAKIYDATQDISLTDKVGPERDLNFEVKAQDPAKMIRGKILGASKHQEMIGAYEFAYINKGSADGFQLNDRILVYRTGDGKQEVTPGLPEVTIAEAVIVNLEPNFATVYCVSSSEQFERGSSFKSAIPEVKYLDSKASSAGADSKSQ